MNELDIGPYIRSYNPHKLSNHEPFKAIGLIGFTSLYRTMHLCTYVHSRMSQNGHKSEAFTSFVNRYVSTWVLHSVSAH